MDEPYLVAGLGNPGVEYARTRHNVGFQVTDLLAERWGCRWEQAPRFRARLALGHRQGRRVWLCQPQTYMNLSGEAVRAVMDYYQVPLTGLLVIVDDADLPLGQIRLRPRGGTGGHRGLASIQSQVGSGDFARLRVGIGRQPGAAGELTNHVLGRFTEAEAAMAQKAFARAANQVECWLAEGIAAAMNQFNGPVDRPASEENAQ